MPFASIRARREAQREYMKRYRERPGVREREKAWRKEYRARKQQEAKALTPPAPEPTFRNVPEDSYICEEGWLIVGDQAWTAEEWNSALGADERKKHAIRYSTEEERIEAKRRAKREHMRRVRRRTAPEKAA